MTLHLTLRLAWYNNGWNGHICKKPARNTYCVGCASYPGALIREQHDLESEKKYTGEPFEKLELPPACMHRGLAFPESSSKVLADPPDFLKTTQKRNTGQSHQPPRVHGPMTPCTTRTIYARTIARKQTGNK